MNQSTITVWDSREKPPEARGIVYLWNGYAETDTIRSLLRYVENHAERLRSKYLALIHDVGESWIDDKRVIDHLVLKDGLSYWWMTLCVEKSLWKSPSITDVIRLFALEEIIIDQKPGKLKLFSPNCSLHEVIADLCYSLGIEYEWEKLPGGPYRLSIKAFYRSLPQPLQAILGFSRHLLIHWPLRNAKRSDWFEGPNALLFCSYFIHLDSESCTNGKFYSRQWEIFPKLLQDNGFRINWIHHYLKSSVLPNTRVALNWVQRFNEHRQDQGFHTFLYSFLSWRIVWRVLKNWLMLIWIAGKLKDLQKVFRPNDSNLSPWPILRQDWRISMYGQTALGNLLWIELFDAALHDVPHQAKGLYLCENQGWERAFIHAWRKHGHGELIAVAHSTVRFWDLRYFNDPCITQAVAPQPMPEPDILVLNGIAAVQHYRRANQPMDKVVKCEALRYLYINNVTKSQSCAPTNSGVTKVLILGDVMDASTKELLRLLEASLPFLQEGFVYFFKPHPFCSIKTEEFPYLNITVLTDPLGEIMKDFDIAYSSNSTSAAVDAYLAKLGVVIMLNENELNLSPLRGESGVCFVSTPEELAAAFYAFKKKGCSESPNDDFIFLDSELPRWRTIFDEYEDLR